MTRDELYEKLCDRLVDGKFGGVWSGGRTALNVPVERIVDALMPDIDAYIEGRAAEVEAMVENYPEDIWPPPGADYDLLKRANQELAERGWPVYDRIGAEAHRIAYRRAAAIFRGEYDER